MDTRLKTIMELDGKDYKKTLKEIAGLENEYYNDSIKSTSKLSKQQEKLSEQQSKNAKKIKKINKELKKELKDFGNLSDTEQEKQEKNHKKRISLLKKERTQTNLTNNIAIKGIRDNIAATKNLITTQETQQKLMAIRKKNAIELQKATLGVAKAEAKVNQELAKAKFKQSRKQPQEKLLWNTSEMKSYYAELESSSKKATLQEKKQKELGRELYNIEEEKYRQAQKAYRQQYMNTKATNAYENAIERLNNELKKGLITNTQYSNATKKEAQRHKEAELATRNHTKSTENLANATIRYLRWAGTIAGVLYATKRAWDATLGSGIEMSKMVENNTYGIAALISANTRMVDSYGNTLTPMQKFVAGQKIAKIRMKELRVEAMKTPATFRQITDVFQQAIGQTMGMGDAFGTTVDEIGKNTVELSSRFSQVAGAIGMPMDRVKEEIRSALTGNVSTDSIISTMLFGSPTQANAKIKEARQSTNGLKKLFDEVFKSFDILSTTRSFDKGFNQMKGAWEIAMGDIVSKSGMFQDITDVFYEMSDKIINNTDDIVKKFDEFYGGIKNISSAVGKITEAFLIYKAVGITGSVIESTAAFVASNGVYDITTRKIRLLTTAQRILNTTILKNPYIIAIASMAIGINYLIDKTDELHEKTKQEIKDSQSNKVHLLGTKEQLQKELSEKERMIKVWKDKLKADNSKYGEDSNIVGIDKAQINGITEAIKKLNEQLDGTAEQKEKTKKSIDNAKEEIKLITKLAIDTKTLSDAKKIILKADGEEVKIQKDIEKYTSGILELKKKLAVEEGKKKPHKISIDMLKEDIKIEEDAKKVSIDKLAKFRENARKKENEIQIALNEELTKKLASNNPYDMLITKAQEYIKKAKGNQKNLLLIGEWYNKSLTDLDDKANEESLKKAKKLADKKASIYSKNIQDYLTTLAEFNKYDPTYDDKPKKKKETTDKFQTDWGVIVSNTFTEGMQDAFNGDFDFGKLASGLGLSVGSAFSSAGMGQATKGLKTSLGLGDSVVGGLETAGIGFALSGLISAASRQTATVEEKSAKSLQKFTDAIDKAALSLGNLDTSGTDYLKKYNEYLDSIKVAKSDIESSRKTMNDGVGFDGGVKDLFKSIFGGTTESENNVKNYKANQKTLADLQDKFTKFQGDFLVQNIDFSKMSLETINSTLVGLKSFKKTVGWGGKNLYSATGDKLDIKSAESMQAKIDDATLKYKKTGVFSELQDVLKLASNDNNYLLYKEWLPLIKKKNELEKESLDNSKANIKEIQLRNETPKDKAIRLMKDQGYKWDGNSGNVDYFVNLMEKSGKKFTKEEKAAALAMYDYSDSIDANRKAVEDAIKGQEYGQAQFIDSLNGTATALDYAKEKVGMLGKDLPTTSEKLIALRQSFIDNDGVIDTYEQAVIDATLATKPFIKVVDKVAKAIEDNTHKEAQLAEKYRLTHTEREYELYQRNQVLKAMGVEDTARQKEINTLLDSADAAKKLAEAQKQSRDAQLATIDYVWEAQRAKQERFNNDQADILRDKIEKNEKEEKKLNKLLSITITNLSSIENVIGSLSSVVYSLRGDAIGVSYSLEQYYSSMAKSMALSYGSDYEAFAKSIQNTISQSSILQNSNAFATSNDQKFAQLVAANQFDSMQSSTMTQVDYLKKIELNTRAQITAIVDVVSALNGSVSSLVTSTANQTVVAPPSLAQREADYLDKYSQVADHYALAPEGSNVATLKASGMTLLEYAKFNYDHYGKYHDREFAIGTSNVPYDMNAKIHKSEIIVPASFSDGLRNGDLAMGSFEVLVKKVEQLTDEVKKQTEIVVIQANEIRQIRKTNENQQDSLLVIEENIA